MKSDKNRILIIAEAGVNHNGSMAIARQLIDAAASAGVDYIKFQTFKTEKLVSRTAPKAHYQTQNTKGETQFTMLKKLELTQEQHFELIEYCKSKNICFLSTAFDLESIDFLDSLHLPIWKIPSGEITNYPYLKKIAQTRKPVLLSTGMCENSDIDNALRVLLRFGLTKDRITILHCNTEYPTPMEDVNLRAMVSIGDQFHVKIGYSDHTLGIEVPIAAAALGATVIEKHFTLDKTMEGPDHKASLDPRELTNMIHSIRNIEKALGSKEKLVTSSECQNITIARKSIVASQHISKGETFTEENLTTKRPGTGLSPMRWEEIIGAFANRNYEPDDLITL